MHMSEGTFFLFVCFCAFLVFFLHVVRLKKLCILGYPNLDLRWAHISGGGGGGGGVHFLDVEAHPG